LVQASAGTGDWRLAKSASKLLVAHMELMAAAAQNPGSCWARVLELEAERATADNRQQMYYPKVVEALTAYYERTQQVEKLQWIAGLHQSRHEVLG